MTGTHSGSVWTVAWCCRRNHLNQPSPCTLSSSCGHCCCFCFLFVCFMTLPSCLSPQPSATLHTLFCVSFSGGARRPSMLLLWSFFMISVTPSLLVLLPANLLERCSGPGCDPEETQMNVNPPWWRTVSVSGPQRPALAYKRRSTSVWLDWMFFCLILLLFFYFTPLRLASAASCVSAW